MRPKNEHQWLENSNDTILFGAVFPAELVTLASLLEECKPLGERNLMWLAGSQGGDESNAARQTGNNNDNIREAEVAWSAWHWN